MAKITGGLALLALLLSACSTSTSALTGEWRLSKLNGADPIAGSIVTLVFDEKQVSGSGGCNTFSGSFSVKSSKITFSDLAMTLMACLDQQVNQQEADYFIALNQVDKFTVSQDSLELTGSNVSLEFVKVNR